MYDFKCLNFVLSSNLIFKTILEKIKSSSQNYLAISVKDSSLNKNDQKAKNIHKKIKKIELLNKQIKKINDTISVAKKLYRKHCEKIENQLLKSKEELIIKLYQRYQQKGFAIWQKEMVETKLINEIDSLISLGHTSEKISKIQEEISQSKIDNMSNYEKEMMNDLTKGFFENMGVDMEGFDFSDINSSDFRKQFEEKQSENYKKEHHDFYQKDKEEKQKLQHNKVKTTNNDFQKLYRNLVKKAHPDLVVDPIEKQIREEWMKELSEVWEERNYYKLLLLQKKILKDDSIDIALSELQIESLGKELNKTINQLEQDKYQLKHFNKDTSFYYENFNAKTEKGVLKKIIAHKNYVEYEVEEIQVQKIHLKTQKSTKELLKEIRESQVGYYPNRFDEFASMEDDFFEF